MISNNQEFDLLKQEKNSRYFLLLAIFFLWITLFFWAVSSPIGASPDEDFHQTHIYCASGKSVECFNDGYRFAHCFSMSPTVSASCANYTELTVPMATKVEWSHYPPLYFNALSWFVGDTLSATTLNVRLVNITLAVVFLLCSILLSQPNLRPAIFVSWIVASMPFGFYFMSSFNPSSWLIISIASLWGPLFTLTNSILLSNENYFHKISVFRSIFILLAAGLGLGSRSEAMIWTPLTVLTILIICFISSPNKLSFVKKYFSNQMLMVTSIFFIILWLIFQLDIFQRQRVGLFAQLDTLFINYIAKMNWQMVQHTFNILLGVTGLPGVPGSGIGTHDVPVPAMAIIFIGYAISSCLLIGLNMPSKRKIFVVLGLIFIIFFITSFLWSLHNWDYLQPRYFLPMFYVILGIILLSNGKYFLGNKWQWGSVLAGLVIANSLTLLSMLLRYMHGLVYQKSRYPLTPNAPDIDPSRLFTQQMPNWWWKDLPFSPSDVWIIGSVSFAFSMLFLWKWLDRSFANEV